MSERVLSGTYSCLFLIKSLRARVNTIDGLYVRRSQTPGQQSVEVHVQPIPPRTCSTRQCA